jgi:hypothetical protein
MYVKVNLCEAYFSNEILQVAEVPSKTVPCIIMLVQTIQRQPLTRALIVRFDPRSTSSYLKQGVLPPGAAPVVHRPMSDSVKCD